MPASFVSIGAFVTDAILGSGALLEAVGISGTVAINTAVGALVVVGADIAVGVVLAPAAQKASQQQVTTRQPIPPRRRYYGRNKAAGPLAFIQTADADLYEAILIASHQISTIEHWIGDRVVVSLDGSGNVTAPNSLRHSADLIFGIIPHSGTDSQTVDALLTAQFPTLWDSDHRLRGIAYVVFLEKGVDAKYFTTFYPGGPQQYRQVFDGDHVYNLTDGGQDYSTPAGWDFGHDNAASVFRDYITHQDGMRLPDSAWLPAIDEWQAAAAICEETITLASSGTDKRYRIAGGYDLDVAPKDQLAKFQAACDGFLYMRGDGAISLKVGKWEDPTVTIDETHVRSFSLPKGIGPLREANEIRAVFVDPNQDYQPVEAAPWRDEADISLRGTVLSKGLDLTYCPTHNQARRMMKIAAARANPERAGTITTDLYGLNALGERRIHVSIPRRNIDLDMEVTSFKIDMASQSCVIGVLAMSSEAYDFDQDTEEGEQPDPPDPGSDNPEGTAPTAPTGIVANNSSGTVTISFLAPNDINVYACRIWRGATTFGSATDISGPLYCSPNQLLGATNSPGAGTWHYWSTAENAGGDMSSEDGPATVTV